MMVIGANLRDRIEFRILASVLLHAALLLLLTMSGRHAPHIATARLPGITHGSQLLTYYSPGGISARSASRLQTSRPRVIQTAPSPALTAAATAREVLSVPRTDVGIGSSGASGVGQGNINIAQQRYFPPPRPNLATLEPGTQGDVIVDATIDAEGKIVQLTLVHGLTEPINEAVLATVQRWTYTPATRDGLPISSEQELLFHFQRG